MLNSTPAAAVVAFDPTSPPPLRHHSPSPPTNSPPLLTIPSSSSSLPYYHYYPIDDCISIVSIEVPWTYSIPLLTVVPIGVYRFECHFRGLLWRQNQMFFESFVEMSWIHW